MPFFIAIVLLQVLFVIHVVRTGRPYVWMAAIMFLPVAGMIAYFIMEILPELMGSAPARAAAGVVNLVDPERGYREALTRVEITDTPANRTSLAEQCLYANRFEEAQALYRGLLTGINATEPDLMLGLARAHFGLGRYDLAQNVLDDLRASNPDYRSADGHLLYARALEQQASAARPPTNTPISSTTIRAWKPSAATPRCSARWAAPSNRAACSARSAAPSS